MPPILDPLKALLSSFITHCSPHKNLPPTTCETHITYLKTMAHRHGFAESVATGRPIAADGSPLPWYTYPAIEYLSQMDATGLRIFEYGCGNSSLFWARKGAHVWSVEHSPEWHSQLHTQSSHLKSLLLRQEKKSYTQAICEHDEMFDIVIIDGVWRNECCHEALKRITPDGLILLDNSDWYTDAAEILRASRYFQIDFNGFGPINNYCWTTSIFLPLASPFTKRIRTPLPICGIPACKGEMW